MTNKSLPLKTPGRVDSRVSVETPEQIQFTFELAGAGTRMMAYLIDLAIRAAAVAVITLTLIIGTGLASPGLAMGLALVLWFAAEWGYHTIFEWLWHGSSPGKRALNIRVVRTDGVAIDLVRSAMRNLLRAADFFPFAYATGLLVMFFNQKERRLGDLAADAIVIREDPVRLRKLPSLPEDAVVLPAGSLENIGLGERDFILIDEFFRRRHLFSSDRANELAMILARPVMKQVNIQGHDPIALLAGLLLAGHMRSSSWPGAKRVGGDH